MIKTRKATSDDVRLWVGTPLGVEVMEWNGQQIAMVSMVRKELGRRYLHLELRVPQDKGPPKLILKYLRKWMAGHTRPLYAACEDLRFPRAPLLMKRLGFVPAFKQGWDDKTVWVLE